MINKIRKYKTELIGMLLTGLLAFLKVNYNLKISWVMILILPVLFYLLYILTLFVIYGIVSYFSIRLLEEYNLLDNVTDKIVMCYEMKKKGIKPNGVKEDEKV